MSPDIMRQMFQDGENLYLAERPNNETRLFSELPEPEKHDYVKRAAEASE
jgi:hypothetical protein